MSLADRNTILMPLIEDLVHEVQRITRPSPRPGTTMHKDASVSAVYDSTVQVTVMSKLDGLIQHNTVLT